MTILRWKSLWSGGNRFELVKIRFETDVLVGEMLKKIVELNIVAVTVLICCKTH